MQYTIDAFGSCQAVEITGANGTYWQVLTQGAILNKYSVQGHDCIVGYNTPQELTQAAQLGCRSALLFPFVCRLENGQFTWQNQTHTVEGFYLQKHALHGFVFEQNFVIENIEIHPTTCTVQLGYSFHGNSHGFPFAFYVQVYYVFHETEGVKIQTTIKNTGENSMPFATGWHPYFTLGNSIDHCLLQLPKASEVELNSELLPTGKLLPTSEFETPKGVGSKHFDTCFLTETKTAVLQNKEWHLQINAIKGYPYLQVYTPDHRHSIALENLSGAPNCFNNGMGLQNLSPNHTAEFTTSYLLRKI